MNDAEPETDELAIAPPGEHDVEEVACNLCGADDPQVLYWSRDYRYGVDDVPYRVVRCRRCGLGYLSPRPSPHAIARYYDRPSYYVGRASDAVGQRLRDEAEYLTYRTSGRLLDVGCAGGEFLQEMAGRGWQVTGVEPFTTTARDRHLLEVYPALTSPQLSGRRFDVITAWSVFEHLHDPMDAFRHVHELLEPGGRLVLHVPNLRSIFSRWSYWEDVPRHLYFFSETTLRRYGDAVGLRLKDVSHDTRIMDGSGRGFLKLRLFWLARLSTADYFAWTKMGRTHRLRRHPVISSIAVPVGIVERLVTSEALRRRLRVNGYVVATFERPGNG